MSAYTHLKLKPNFNPLKTGPAIYATVSGLPVHKFRMPIKQYTTYMKQIITYGNRTEYTLSDSRGNKETFVDTSETNEFTRSSKMYTKGVEYHIQIPCIDKEKKHCGIPFTDIPQFPLEIKNFPPTKVKILSSGLGDYSYESGLRLYLEPQSAV
jgi:hypothetical protein